MGRAGQGQIEHTEVAEYFRDTYDVVPDRSFFDAVSENFDDRDAMAAYLRDRIPQTLSNPYNQLDIATLAAYAGAPELALEALQNSLSFFAINIAIVWSPLFREVRQLEEFRDYMREIGMVEVWQQVGWPDLCEPIGDDFRCD
jgi:hypothetical protein